MCLCRSLCLSFVTDVYRDFFSSLRISLFRYLFRCVCSLFVYLCMRLFSHVTIICIVCSLVMHSVWLYLFICFVICVCIVSSFSYVFRSLFIYVCSSLLRSFVRCFFMFRFMYCLICLFMSVFMY